MCSCEDEDIAGLVDGAGEIVRRNPKAWGWVWEGAFGLQVGCRSMQHASCMICPPEAPIGADAVITRLTPRGALAYQIPEEVGCRRLYRLPLVAAATANRRPSPCRHPSQ